MKDPHGFHEFFKIFIFHTSFPLNDIFHGATPRYGRAEGDAYKKYVDNLFYPPLSEKTRKKAKAVLKEKLKEGLIMDISGILNRVLSVLDDYKEMDTDPGISLKSLLSDYLKSRGLEIEGLEEGKPWSS